MMATRPLPVVTPDTAPFWEGLSRGELRMQTCSECGRMRFYPGPVCPYCRSRDSHWVTVSGHGTIDTWTVVHRTTLSWFADNLPYVVALIRLAEDPTVRIASNVEIEDPADLREGMAVEARFSVLADSIGIHHFVPVDATASGETAGRVE